MISKSQLKRISTQKEKHVVYYETLAFLREGHSAIVYKVTGHQRQDVDLLHENEWLSGEGYVTTSPVIRIIRGRSLLVKGLRQPTFETQNTIYTPKKATR